jgi:uncharacterized repeat protein (TIGR01451 family)
LHFILNINYLCNDILIFNKLFTPNDIMKKIFTLIFLVVFFADAKAQYVSIPDAKFATFLRINYPSAMSGSLLDTTNTGIVNATSLNCSYNLIANLYGVQFFDKLESLICTGNPITSWPALPASLKSLDCAQCSLTGLPALPDSLIELNCGQNMLVTLPTLPATLTVLQCHFNDLTSLSGLPNLTSLLCHENNLTSISSLPSTLLYFACANNNLTSLPPLPSGMKQFNCTYNSLTSLPTLPDSLVTLHCSENFLETLPTLPNSLVELNCSNNRLSSISNISDSLVIFYCWDNPNLYCLPPFTNKSFFEFGVTKNTGISCLPKAISIHWASDSSAYLPICTPSTGCPIVNNIMGAIHQDTSASCALDSLHNGVALKNIKVKKYKNGVLNHQEYISLSGYYSFDADITDSIDVVVDTLGLPLNVSCPVIGRRSAKLTLGDSMFYNQDFGIKCKGVDLGINAIYGTFRKGFTRPLLIRAGDLSSIYNLNCSDGTSGTVTTTITGAASYSAPYPDALTPSSVSGSTITYTISDFGAIDLNSAFNIWVKTDSAAVVGSNICINSIISTTATDINHFNDTLNYCGNVVNSFDPNDKLVYPTNTTGIDEWLTYTINFQNTGTDTAYHIIVRDTLDSYLNLGSFTYLASSHNPQIDIDGNAVMFNFPRINLVDSLHNEAESHGWVQYKIKTLAALPPLVTIKNKASIYFDDNDPVVTNTTSNINTSLSIRSHYQMSAFKIYPNPASSNITIEATETGEFKMFNLLGSEVYHATVSKSNTITNISLPKLANGLYIYQFSSDVGTTNTGKLFIDSSN